MASFQSSGIDDISDESVVARKSGLLFLIVELDITIYIWNEDLRPSSLGDIFSIVQSSTILTNSPVWIPLGLYSIFLLCLFLCLRRFFFLLIYLVFSLLLPTPIRMPQILPRIDMIPHALLQHLRLYRTISTHDSRPLRINNDHIPGNPPSAFLSQSSTFSIFTSFPSSTVPGGTYVYTTSAHQCTKLQ